MSDLRNNYLLYRSYFKLPALVAYLAAKACLAGEKRPLTVAWCDLDAQGLWLAKYIAGNGGKCEAIRVKGAR